MIHEEINDLFVSQEDEELDTESDSTKFGSELDDSEENDDIEELGGDEAEEEDDEDEEELSGEY
ncbi:MAG: hypothetical protein ABH876_01025 [Patescibacteria group bacterium]|nr:hypothetical protein [Patescibacteria group bacterium]MBU1876809.1 hypothetical protein [Patescibacteria group bacterium]